jgi:hypothetical protein
VSATLCLLVGGIQAGKTLFHQPGSTFGVYGIPNILSTRAGSVSGRWKFSPVVHPVSS